MFKLVHKSGATPWDLLPTEIIASGVDLYLAGGFGQLFRRVHEGSSERFDNSWLYIPSGFPDLELAATESGDAPDSSQPFGRAIVVDDQRLYPLVHQSRIVGVLVASGSTVPSGESVERLMARIAPIIAPAEQNDNLGEEFAARLFHRDSSQQSFYRRLFAWLTDLWPKSFAGVYMESQGTYVLRTSVGNIDRCYRLPREMSAEVAERLLGAAGEGPKCTPLDTMPDHPAFLDAAPDILFVHSGINSDCTKQLIAVAGPGDVDWTLCRRLFEVASLVGSLKEHQFATSNGLIEFYSRLALEEFTGFNSPKLLADLFEHVSQQINLSQMVVAVLDTRKQLVIPFVLPGSGPTGEQSQPIAPEMFPDSIVAQVLKNEMYHMADINDGVLNVEQAKKRYFGNVKAESCVPLRTPQGVSGFLAFGSPISGSYLADREPLLVAVADFVAFYVASLQRHGAAEQLLGTKPESTAAPAGLAHRLLMVHKLSEGCLHDMSDSLSVMLGQAEIARSAAEEASEGDASHRVHLDRISRAAESMSGRLDALRQICTCSRLAQDSTIDGARLIRDLPVILSGLARQVKDTKNIEVTVVVASRELPAMTISPAFAFDVLLPMIIALMEEAVCSGQVKVSAETSPLAHTLVLSFARKLVGGSDLTELLCRTFNDKRPFTPEEAADIIHVGTVTISAERAKDDRFRIRIQQPSGTDLSGSPTTPDTSDSIEGRR
jgi:hypothetical protein